MSAVLINGWCHIALLPPQNGHRAPGLQDKTINTPGLRALYAPQPPRNPHPPPHPHPSPQLSKYYKTLITFCRIKHDEMSSFRLHNGFRLPENKQGCQTLKTNLRKRHFIQCHATKCYTTPGVFISDCPGVFTSAPPAMLKAEINALGMI